MKKLMVKINNKWEYVFCHSHDNGLVTTKDRRKALKGDSHALEHFSNKYANNDFALGRT